jgi:predicted membrane channel-forming protein YqfA (hemolysin III family)
VGWVTLFVLVLTRRTVYQMRGSRLAVALLAAMVLSTVVLRIALPIPVSRYVPRRFSWGWGLYGAGALALMAMFYAWHFGGKRDELETRKPRRGDETLH